MTEVSERLHYRSGSLEWRVTENDSFSLAEFKIAEPDGVLAPSCLADIDLPPGLDTSQGLVLSGRGPVWLYGYLVHCAHHFAWVGVYDPRLKGAVVVECHAKKSHGVGHTVRMGIADTAIALL